MIDDYTTHTTTLVIFMINNRKFAFEEWRKAGKRFKQLGNC